MRHAIVVAMVVAFAALFALAPAWSTRVLAAEATRAVVIAADANDKLVLQLRAELAAQGFDVVVETSSDPMANVAPIAQAAGAYAVVTVETPPRVVRVWLLENGPSPVTEIATFGPIGGGDDEARVAAVRAAESLHAATLELEKKKKLAALGSVSASASSSAPAASASVAPSVSVGPSLVAPPPPPADGIAPRPVATPEKRLSIDAGLAMLASAGGIPALLDGAIGASLRFGDAWSMRVFAELPLRGATISAIEGSTYVHASLFGADVSRAFVVSRIVRASIGVGVAAAHLRFDGSARAPYVGATDAIWTAVPFVRAGESFELGTWSVRVDALLGLATPRASASFAGREVATWGRPVVILSPSIAYAFL